MRLILEDCMVIGHKQFESKKQVGKVYYSVVLAGSDGNVLKADTDKDMKDEIAFGAKGHAVLDYEKHPQYGERWRLIAFKKTG